MKHHLVLQQRRVPVLHRATCINRLSHQNSPVIVPDGLSRFPGCTTRSKWAGMCLKLVIKMINEDTKLHWSFLYIIKYTTYEFFQNGLYSQCNCELENGFHISDRREKAAGQLSLFQMDLEGPQLCLYFGSASSQVASLNRLVCRFQCPVEVWRRRVWGGPIIMMIKKLYSYCKINKNALVKIKI